MSDPELQGEGRPQLVITSPFFFDANDSLQITAWNALASVVLTVTGRFIHVNGDVEAFSERFVPTSNRVASSAIFPRACGWLTECSVIASGAAPVRGQTFVRVDVVRGQTTPIIALSTVLQGYVTATKRIAFPGSVIEDSVSGQGAIRSITGTDPAAQVELTETVPTGARWRFIGLRVQLVTDANVINRVPVLTFDDGAAAYAGAAGNFNQTATTTFTYHFGAVGASHAQSSAAVMVSTPANLILLAAHRIRTVTGGPLQAADNYGAPQYVVEEWLEAV